MIIQYSRDSVREGDRRRDKMLLWKSFSGAEGHVALAARPTFKRWPLGS